MILYIHTIHNLYKYLQNQHRTSLRIINGGQKMARKIICICSVVLMALLVSLFLRNLTFPVSANGMPLYIYPQFYGIIADPLYPDASQMPWAQQHEGNYCGPAVVGELLDWIEIKNNKTPTFDEDALMQWMATTYSSSLPDGLDGSLALFSSGSNFKSYGTLWNQVRGLNTAYDFGTDPHALAWTI